MERIKQIHRVYLARVLFLAIITLLAISEPAQASGFVMPGTCSDRLALLPGITPCSPPGSPLMYEYTPPMMLGYNGTPFPGPTVGQMSVVPRTAIWNGSPWSYRPVQSFPFIPQQQVMPLFTTGPAF